MGLRIVKRAAVVAAILAGMGVPAIASEIRSPFPGHDRPDVSRVSGTIRVNGCRVRPSQIELAAFPLQPELEREAVAPIDREAVIRRAVVLPTLDPRVFHFRISRLRPEVSYRLKIGLPPNPCGRIFWRGPLGGMAAGGQRRLSIEGFVATSELEVLDAAANQWVGMDHLAFGDPRAGTRSFRWRSSLPGERGGELQLSTAPFPVGDDGCSEPEEGILLRRDVARSAGRWTQTGPVDFNDLLLPVRGRAAPGQNGPRTTEVTDATLAQLSVGAPLYVRVVPRTRRGLACDTKRLGVGGWVVLAQLPDGPPPPVIVPPSQPALEAGNDHSYEPSYLDFWSDGAIHPQYHEEGFLAVKDHVMPSKLWCQYGNLFDQTDVPGFGLDSYGCMLVFANALPEGTLFKAGSRFKVYQTTTSTGGSGPLGAIEDFTNAFGNVVTGTISAVGWAVDSLSKLYEDAKKAVAQFVKDVFTVLPVLGQLCSAHPEECEAAIQTGITTGLTAMGMPPSLPNWDALKQEGVDYLAAEVASQTGAPQVVVDMAAEVAQKAIEEMTAKRGLLPQPGYDWLIPYLGTDPAVLTVDIRKNDPSPLSVPLSLLRSTSVPFVGGTSPIPRVFVNDPTHLRMPMVLRPNLSGIPAPLCTFPLGGPISCGPNVFNPQTAACRMQVFGQGGSTYEFFPCPEKVVAIYYRSEWIPKLATGCTTLASAALSPGLETVFVETPFGPLPKYQWVWKAVPGLSFVVLGAVQPPVPFSWSGPFGSDCN